MKWQHYLIIFLLLTGGAAVYQFTRGIRNNNPGNIRYNDANNWQGQTGKDDKGFVIFSDSKYGIRAIGKVIDSYKRRGLLSIRDIISTWAPSSENNTEAYVESVVKKMNVPTHHYQPARDDGDYPSLVKAIITHENGVNPYSDETIKSALAMA